jgi:hypothetical protein
MDDFERSLKLVPYAELLDDAEIEALKKEYADVTAIDLKLSLQKYFEANMSADELKAFANRDDAAVSKASGLAKQFYEMEQIPETYKVKDIKQTPIYKALANIRKLLRDYQDLAMQNVDSSKKAAECFVNLKDNLKNLNNSAQLALIDEIITKSFNMSIFVQKKFHPMENATECEKRWEQLKNSLNANLIRYKNELLKEAAGDNSGLITLSEENIDRLSEYFTAQFNGRGKSENLFKNALIPCLTKVRNSGRDYSAIAWVIYKSPYFKDNRGDSKISFSKWANILFEIMNIQETIYKPAQIRELAEGYKNGEFYFLNK